MCEKCRKKILKWQIYGPQTQFYPQYKVLIFGMHIKNILNFRLSVAIGPFET